MVFAILRGDVEAVNGLATSAAHLLLKERKDGWLPLHDAAYCGQTECLKALLTGAASEDNVHIISHIGGVVAFGPVCLISPPLAHPDTINRRTLEEQTALLIAVWFKHPSCVQCLLEAGADPNICNKDKETPLYKGAALNSSVYSRAIGENNVSARHI